MPVKLFCEVCGELMGDVSIKNLKKYYDKHGERCKKCIKMEEDLKSFIEKKKAFFLQKYTQLTNECKEYMQSQVQELIDKRAEELAKKMVQQEIDNG